MAKKRMKDDTRMGWVRQEREIIRSAAGGCDKICAVLWGGMLQTKTGRVKRQFDGERMYPTDVQGSWRCP